MWKSRIYEKFVSNPSLSNLPDFSYAGYYYGERKIPYLENTVCAADYGAVPNTNEDMTAPLQKAIDDLSAQGGGVLFIPKGTYLLNCDCEHKNYLRINSSNIILRGEITSEGNTILKKQNNLLLKKKPWLSPGIITVGENLWGHESFLTPENMTFIGYLNKPALKGERKIHLSQTRGLHKGDCIVLCMKNTDDEGSLTKQLISPLEIEEVWDMKKTAGARRAVDYQWLVEIEEILKDNTVILKQPLRIDVPLHFEPFVCQIHMVEEVGIENICFESSWNGWDYTHHKTPEYDYGWTAVVFNQVKNGFVRNISIDNYVQGVQLRNSRNCTVLDVKISGCPGHYGVKCYWLACDNLFKRVDIQTHRTHVAGIEGFTQGNVFSDFTINAPGSDIDLHGGGSPAFNLYEGFRGIGKISGGASVENLPHSSHYNTFWNIEVDRRPYDREFSRKSTEYELFLAWHWEKEKRQGNICHHMYPKSIVAGIYHKHEPVNIENTSQDRADKWIEVEGLNKSGINPQSLYQAQLAVRKELESEKTM